MAGSGACAGRPLGPPADDAPALLSHGGMMRALWNSEACGNRIICESVECFGMYAYRPGGSSPSKYGS